MKARTIVGLALVVLGVAALSVGVMVYRMLQIWTVQSA